MVAEVIGHDEDNVRTVLLASYRTNGGEEEEKKREAEAKVLHEVMQWLEFRRYISNLREIAAKVRFRPDPLCQSIALTIGEGSIHDHYLTDKYPNSLSSRSQNS